MDNTNIMLMLCSLLIGNCIFFSFYLLRKKNSKKKQSQLSKVLGFLLLAFALRIIKSLVYIVFPEYALVLTKIGIIGMFFIGPLFWMYVLGTLGRLHVSLLHFLIGFSSVPMLFVLNNGSVHTVYIISLLHMLIYLITGFKVFMVGVISFNLLNNWLGQLFLAMFLIWIGFLLQAFVYDTTWYIGITAIVVMVFFSICFIGMLNIESILRYSKSKIEIKDGAKELVNRAHGILDDEKLYLNSNLTLDVLAKKVGTSRHELSFALNNVLKKSFPELLNEIRIGHSKNILKDDENRIMSIETIAYESGFNSLSTFYQNFKRNTGITPAEFREKLRINPNTENRHSH